MFTELRAVDSHETICMGQIRLHAIISGTVDSFRSGALSGRNSGITLSNKDLISDPNYPPDLLKILSKMVKNGIVWQWTLPYATALCSLLQPGSI